MDALVDVLATDGITGFSVQGVADRAEVAHRTVYRYYPSKEALLEGLTDYLEAPMRAAGLPGIPEDLESGTIGAIEPLYRFFETHAPLIEALVVVRLALGIEPKRSQERTRSFIELVREEAPHLTPEEARRYGLGLRSIASSQHWYVLTRRLGLTSDEAADITTQTLRALIGEIRRQNTRQRPKGES